MADWPSHRTSTFPLCAQAWPAKNASMTAMMRRICFIIISSAKVTDLTNATVIGVTGAAPQNVVTIVMETGHLGDMGPTSKISAPAGATVVDLSGKFIVPGIINAHGHVDAKRDL